MTTPPPIFTDAILELECRRLLGKIKHLSTSGHLAATEQANRHWYEESRSYAAELATALLLAYPDIVPLE